MDLGCKPQLSTNFLVKNWVASDKGVWRRGAAMERCRGEATMVHMDHISSWWGVELLIPLLKHTNEFYLV
jgi:hypothetical protein